MRITVYSNKVIDSDRLRMDIEKATGKQCIIKIQKDNSMEGQHAQIYSER